MLICFCSSIMITCRCYYCIVAKSLNTHQSHGRFMKNELVGRIEVVDNRDPVMKVSKTDTLPSELYVLINPAKMSTYVHNSHRMGEKGAYRSIRENAGPKSRQGYQIDPENIGPFFDSLSTDATQGSVKMACDMYGTPMSKESFVHQITKYPIREKKIDHRSGVMTPKSNEITMPASDLEPYKILYRD